MLGKYRENQTNLMERKTIDPKLNRHCRLNEESNLHWSCISLTVMTQRPGTWHLISRWYSWKDFFRSQVLEKRTGMISRKVISADVDHWFRVLSSRTLASRSSTLHFFIAAWFSTQLESRSHIKGELPWVEGDLCYWYRIQWWSSWESVMVVDDGYVPEPVLRRGYWYSCQLYLRLMELKGARERKIEFWRTTPISVATSTYLHSFNTIGLDFLFNALWILCWLWWTQ